MRILATCLRRSQTLTLSILVSGYLLWGSVEHWFYCGKPGHGFQVKVPPLKQRDSCQLFLDFLLSLTGLFLLL